MTLNEFQLEGMALEIPKRKTSDLKSSPPLLPAKNKIKPAKKVSVSGGVKIYPEIPDLNCENNPFSPDSFSKSTESEEEDDVDEPLYATLDFKTQISEKSSLEQEQKINALKKNIATLNQIEASIENQLERTSRISLTNSESDSDNLSLSEVKMLLDKALETINYASNTN